MERPKLNKIDLKGVMAEFLDGCAGNNLIEVDDNEMPVRAYRKKMDVMR